MGIEELPLKKPKQKRRHVQTEARKAQQASTLSAGITGKRLYTPKFISRTKCSSRRPPLSMDSAADYDGCFMKHAEIKRPKGAQKSPVDNVHSSAKSLFLLTILIGGTVGGTMPSRYESFAAPARGQFFLSRFARVNASHVGIFPAEHRHQLMLACSASAARTAPILAAGRV